MYCINVDSFSINKVKFGKNIQYNEFELKKILPPEESNDFCHRVVLHGREVCTARRAMCDKCCLSEFCKKKI